MKYTLLEMVQLTLSALGEAPVNELSDTTLAEDIAGIVRTEYNRLIADRDWKNLTRTIKLDSVADLTRPNYLKIPNDVTKVNLFKYEKSAVGDTKREFARIGYLDPLDFVEHIHERNTDDATVDLVEDFGGILLFIRNDREPEYWTSFDDRYIVTDSYNSAIEDTLHNEKSLALVEVAPPFRMEPDFIPDLQDRLFPALLSEVKAKAYFYKKQQTNNIDAVDAKTGKYHQYTKEGVTDGKIRRRRRGRHR